MQVDATRMGYVSKGAQRNGEGKACMGPFVYDGVNREGKEFAKNTNDFTEIEFVRTHPYGRRRQGRVFGGNLVAFIALFFVVLMPFLGNVVEASVLFTTTNTAELSLYQAIEISFSSNVLAGDPKISTGDIFYFRSTSAVQGCSKDGSIVPGNRFTILSADSEGYAGKATVVGRSDVFTVGTSYTICYIAGTQVYEVLRGEVGKTSLLVWPNIYSLSSVVPTTPSGGQGPVQLTLQQAEAEKRPINTGLSGSKVMFLLPCPKDDEDCSDANALPQRCVAAGTGQLPEGTVQLSATTGAGTEKVTGSFTVPYVPKKYAVCVPYCHSGAAKCGMSSVPMSYALAMSSSKPSEALVLKFAAANPGKYAVTPTVPQARELGYMFITGEKLSASDEVRVIRQESSCTTASSSLSVLVPNLELGSVKLVNKDQVSITFKALDLISAMQTGRVCYKRSGENIWSTVYKSSDNQVADFTLSVLQPTSFKVSPTSPSLGIPITLTFTGEGIDAATDAVFLTSSVGRDACETQEKGKTFVCVMGGRKSPTCSVTVDPATNVKMSLQVCYRKNGRTNFAQIAGTVDMLDRNPISVIKPYPVYAGQKATVEFIGRGLSIRDTIKFIPSDGVCGTTASAETFKLANGKEIVAGMHYSYDGIGQEDKCLHICYMIAGTNVWSIVRSSQSTQISSKCDANTLYVSSYPLRYKLPNSGSVTAMETLSVQLSSATSIARTLKLVRSTDACVTTFCDKGSTACEMDTDPSDYISSVSGSSVTLFLGAKNTWYILCALNGGNVYIPVLPKDGEKTPTKYAFQSTLTNPMLESITPDPWRVALAELSSTFTGTGLDSSKDSVMALLENALISTSPPVCPSPLASPNRVLISSLTKGVDTTKTTVTYTQSDRLHTDAVVHLCYVWGSGRVTYTGSTKIAVRVPSQMTTTEVPVNGFRAGLPITLTFRSKTTALQPKTDSLYFYRFPSTSTGISDCFCRSTCPSDKRVAYDRVPLVSSPSGEEVTWTLARGFDNFLFNAVYIVCYTATGLGVSSYMGRLDVGAANPTYYTVTNSDSIRVGFPLSFQAIERCTEASCSPLTLADKMRVIPSTTECYQLNDDPISGEAETIDDPILNERSILTQRFVANAEGHYRVCYKLSGNGAKPPASYQELPYTENFIRAPLQIGAANPSAFATTPSAPSAGQFLTVKFTCTATSCSHCTKVRLVPGVKASCWKGVKGTFTSDSCPSTTSMQFYDQYLPAGSFTVCHGNDMVTSQRVPGTLTVAAANPATFTISTVDVFTNQESDVTVTVDGSGLQQADVIFLVTESGLSCHSLRNGEFSTDATLRGWFYPSTSPNPLTVASDGKKATWIVSNHAKRFGAGILNEARLCTNVGVSCRMKLCYSRAGGTWAPVPIETGPPVQLLPSDPVSAHFDRYPLFVGIYTSVVVVGRNLQVEDVLVVRQETCAGAAMTVSVGTATVNVDRTQWIGVVRFTEKKSNSRVAVCYERKVRSTTEIGKVKVGDSEANVIYVFDEPGFIFDTKSIAVGHSLSRYQFLIVGAAFGDSPESNIEEMNLIIGTTECNYMPYYTTNRKAPEFPVVLKLIKQASTYFAGRLSVEPGNYALCVKINNNGLFRVTKEHPTGASLTITKPNPLTYTTIPNLPFPDQSFKLSFTLGDPFVAGSTVQIIDGTLFDCGMHNTAVVLDADVSLGTNGEPGVTGISLTKDFIGKKLTVCYRRTGGTFATVPRNDVVDRSLTIMEQSPKSWIASPIQLQAQQIIKITFLAVDSHPNFLQGTDKAFLVLLDGSQNAKDSPCLLKPSISSDTLVKVGSNTMWSISANMAVVGTYAVCYTSTGNDMVTRVPPATLIIAPLQSPRAIFRYPKSPVSAFSGERFYLMFDTVENLDLVLSTASGADKRDSVLFSKTTDCKSPLSSSEVGTIPSDFEYAPLKVMNEAKIVTPYLHLVFRATGTFFVCVRRTGRQADQVYFTYDVIGGVDAPATVSITSSPITKYTTNPTSPRAWVPLTNVIPTYAPSFEASQFAQLFFVSNTASSTSNIDVFDECYRPTKEEAKDDGKTKLLDTKLQVTLSTLLTVLPFPEAGDYRLCLQLTGSGTNVASVPVSIHVNNPSPTAYIVPEVIVTGVAFKMDFLAKDPIFSPTNLNKAHIFATDANAKNSIPPKCSEGVEPEGGSVSFKVFTITSPTSASVNPNIVKKGYYFVCFTLYDQTMPFAVPNNGGGFLFSVGYTGAQRYVVSPSPAYMGQELSIEILGSLLSDKDHVKLVDVTKTVGSTDLSTYCKADAPNVDAAEANGAAGSVVNAKGSAEAEYTPRVNSIGRFILCYQSIRLNNAWSYVSDVASFTVGSPRPSTYTLTPAVAYATESDTLVITDDKHDKGILSASDSIRLVTRGSGARGFDCTESALASNSIGSIKRVVSASSSSEAVYRLCGTGAASVTVCYRLTSATWAEVPLRFSPPSYVFAPLNILANPFTGPTISPESPRPYEPFTLTFKSSDVKATVNFVSFAVSPQAVCAESDPTYVTPAHYAKDKTTPNLFTVALSTGGTYELYLGAHTTQDPRIHHGSKIVVAACDPCDFTPKHTFLSNTVEINFPSSADDFDLKDTLRLVHVSQGVDKLPCNAPTGAFAGETLVPIAGDSSSTTFRLFVGKTSSFLGDFYMCYRRGGVTGVSNYALVSDAQGKLVTFSIYPALPTQAKVCPTAPSFLETTRFQFTLDRTLYPNLGFSKQDNFMLVPINTANPVECEKETVHKPGYIRPVASTVDTNAMTWLSTLPNGHKSVNYQMCFRLAGDALYRPIQPSPFAVAAQNPSQVQMIPPTIGPDDDNFEILLVGTGLSSKDNVYVVEASQRCDETCGVTLTPTEFAQAVYTKVFESATSVRLKFTQSLKAKVTLALCYRRTGHLLTRLAVFFVGETNPSSYKTDFAARLGTRPTLTFSGTSLTAGDRVMIVEVNTYCDPSLAAATAQLINVASDHTQSSFYLPLIGNVVLASYSVCYMRAGEHGYAQMATPLTVLPGGPSFFTTSNTPMQGRATVINLNSDTAYTSRKEDEAFVACAGCSCFDGPGTAVAKPPYGNPIVKATADAEVLTIRVGMNNMASYPVCYRVADSGFAEIGGGSSHLRPIANAPTGVNVFPLPTFQGQRLTLLTSGFNTIVKPEDGDAAMLVTRARLCWDTEKIAPNGILVAPSNVKEVSVATGKSTWHGHVPSLGPGVQPASMFPLSYLYCYRQKGQTEFMHVPFPSNAFQMSAANPATFVSSPPSVSSGVIGAKLTFPKPSDGDTAYIVVYNGADALPNGPCDHAKSNVVAAVGSAFPSYRFSLPPGLTTGKSAVVCYTRAKESVAEVPQLLPLAAPNPSGFTTNIAHQALGRLRQYIVFTILGQGLDPDADAVAFTDVDCASAAAAALGKPITSSSFVRRVGDLHATPKAAVGTSVTIVVQFLRDTTTPVTAHVCYRLGAERSSANSDGQWSEVGTPLRLHIPAPSTLALNPKLGAVRAGQHVQITLIGNDNLVPNKASIISAKDTDPGSWCHDFTDADVREPLLRVTTKGLLDIPIWQHPGAARVCVQNKGVQVMPWADVAPTQIGSAADVTVLDANPSALQAFPKVPRVEQQVTLTFTLIVAANKGDFVRIAELTNDACDESTSIAAFDDKIPVTVVDTMKSRVTLIDKTDKLAYRSFSHAGNFKVCYYAATEAAWAVVGGSLAMGTLRVLPLAPTQWANEGGSLVFARPFTLRFADDKGNLNAAGGDIVWAAPLKQSCGVDPVSCPKCIRFDLDTKASTPTSVVASTKASLAVGTFNLCYRLVGATAAMLPVPLSITAGPVECVENTAVRVGEEQKVKFRKRTGVDVSADSWRVSFFGTSAVTCADGYVEDFVEGRARLLENTDTSVTFGVEWPVSMVASRYVLCYKHNGVVQPMCTCDQINHQNGECFIETLAASPRQFLPVHAPTYVGQTIQLRFTLAADMTKYLVTAVKFVSHVNKLSACRDAAAFDTSNGKLTTESPTSYVFTFQHDYTKGPDHLIVCVLSPMLSSNYARVGTVPLSKSTHLLEVRPYLALTTLPSSKTLIRARETIQLTFTHDSKEKDDIISADDRVTFVTDPTKCVESAIGATPADDILKLFMLGDTSFSSIPADVDAPNNAARSSRVTVTFDPAHGLGVRYVCYKLKDGTWAPVLPSINVLNAGITTCQTANPPNPPNGGGVSLRAMQYVRTLLVSADKAHRPLNAGDGARVVPQSASCMDDAAVVFSTEVVVGAGAQDASVVAFAPTDGTFKVCYRVGGPSSTTALWSPGCSNLIFVSASPTGSFTGCLRVGQTLVVTTTHSTGFKFTNSDRMRFVPGDDQCLYATGDDKQTVATTITVGDSAQTTAGTAVSSTTATWTLPPALLAKGTTSFRLCYTDATGNQFAVPIQASQPAASKFSVVGPNPVAVQMQERVVAGQRAHMVFTGTTTDGVAALVPYLPVPPKPYAPGAPYNEKFDAATALAVGDSTVYREGRCYVANVNTFGVYGDAMKTLGSFDPVAGGLYVSCYRPAGCSVQDVTGVFRVGGYNPSTVAVAPKSPRRGQLLSFVYSHNKEEPNTPLLTPGQDRASVKVGISSCWSLTTKGGLPVGGTSDSATLKDIIYPAQSPGSPFNTWLRACYQLSGGSWSEVPGGTIELLSANPREFSMLTGPPRQGQLNYMQFKGISLGKHDKVKIIEFSQSCTDGSVPPDGIASHASKTSTAVAGSANGWDVTDATSTGATSTLIISSSITGRFSVCYRLSSDTVWTLVYGSLTIYPRNPGILTMTPSSALEGELFTLNFEAATDASSDEFALSAKDTAVLYYGSVSCLDPGGADRIQESPSRVDDLPLKVSYQMAASQRGHHTLCYWRGVPGLPTSTIVWGFPSVKILDNPVSYLIFPLATVPLRENQVLSIVFDGFGLISDKVRTDEVKFIDSSNPQTDKACRTVENSVSAHKYALKANGTHAVQVFRAKATKASYWICYKLNGGQFHLIPGTTLSFTAADPTGTMDPYKRTTVLDGEMLKWIITTTVGAEDGDYIFYSSNGCNDFPYYAVPGSPIQSSSFPKGVALVQGTSTKSPFALLRAGAAVQSAPYSVCYRGKNDVITLLSEEAVTVEAGVPPILGTSVEATALQIFTFTLDVTPTAHDYVALVLDPNTCVGEKAPLKSDEVFILLESKPLDGIGDSSSSASRATVTAAVKEAGTYYICYSHRVDRCAPGTSRECARIVGIVVAAQPRPSSWSMAPSTVYTTDLMEAIIINPPSKGGVAWLAPIPSSSATMRDVGIACLRPHTEAGRITLTHAASGNDDKWIARLNIAGAYGLCYTPIGAVYPAIFPPIASAGPDVQLSKVTATMFSSPPVVGATSTVILSGRGLSQEDTLVAVAVSGGSPKTPPADICTNNNYTPRVVADVSTAGYGLNSISRSLRFTVSTRYVLCYKASASTGTMVLITPTPFIPTQLQVTVSLASVALINTPLYLAFRGHDLSIMDQAALIHVPSADSDDSKVCSTGKYAAMVGVNGDGIEGLFTTTPTQMGIHVVCYRKQGLSNFLLMSTRIDVGVRTAVKAVFKQQPVCNTGAICKIQPVVALVDAQGHTTTDPMVTVRMHLSLSNGTNVDQHLSGGAVYTHTDYSIFQFIALGVSTVGRYQMVAKFDLFGGATLQAQSEEFGVVAGEPSLATVTCSPVGIIERSLVNNGESNSAASITCIILATSTSAATAYQVSLNAGTHTKPTNEGKGANGMPQYKFTVFPPHNDLTTQFVAITVTPLPSGTWPVANSPVIVRIGSIPSEGSMLFCASGSKDLRFPTMVRSSDALSCHAQGNRYINGKLVNILSMPKYIRISRQSNDDASTNTAINIGDYPESLQGHYAFSVNVPAESHVVTVLGSVPESDGNTGYTFMYGSPSRFIVIGVPMADASKLVCVSSSTESKRWFLASEVFTCTLTLRNSAGLINGVPRDYTVRTLSGGSVQLLSHEMWGSTLTLQGNAPSSSAPQLNIYSLSVVEAMPLEVTQKGSAVDRSFEVQVTYAPLRRVIASSVGIVVHLSSLNTKEEEDKIILDISGSGISLSHKYGVRSNSNCTAGVEREAVLSDKSVENNLSLIVPLLNAPFHLCFLTNDGPKGWARLTNEAVHVLIPDNTAGLGMWTILLIVGIILLFILLLLLAVLLWRVFANRGEKPTRIIEDTVYMPPRVNDRFVFSSAGSTSALSSQAPGQQRPDGGRVRSQNNTDRHLHSSEVSGEGGGPPVTRSTNVKQRRQRPQQQPQEREWSARPSQRTRSPRRSPHAAHDESCIYSDPEEASSGDSDGQRRRLPRVPPPLPPYDVRPQSIAAASDRRVDLDAPASPRAGPYQHLHHQTLLHGREDAMAEEQPFRIAPAGGPGDTGDGGEQQTWVGPFTVKGHTSRPLVGSPSHLSGSLKSDKLQ